MVRLDTLQNFWLGWIPILCRTFGEVGYFAELVVRLNALVGLEPNLTVRWLSSASCRPAERVPPPAETAGAVAAFGAAPAAVDGCILRSLLKLERKKNNAGNAPS